MSEVDAAPPAETDDGEFKPIRDVLAERHKPQDTHEAHREVGDEDEDGALAALAERAPPAAATPEPKPAPAPAAPAASAATDPVEDPKSPRWFRDEMKKLRAENQRLASTQGRADPAPTPRPAAPPAELPNPAEDPQGYHDAVQRGLHTQMQRFQLETKLNLSERFATQQHGAEAFEDCRAWLSTKPDIEAWAIQQPDPWAAAFTQYNRERLAEEIGEDPKAWQEKERQRIRDEVRAEMEAEGGQPAPARQPPQMRAVPPAPASTARAAAPRDPSTGKFTGPAPLTGAFRHKFT